MQPEQDSLEAMLAHLLARSRSLLLYSEVTRSALQLPLLEAAERLQVLVKALDPDTKDWLELDARSEDVY
jgi:hypothetical protein